MLQPPRLPLLQGSSLFGPFPGLGKPPAARAAEMRAIHEMITQKGAAIREKEAALASRRVTLSQAQHAAQQIQQRMALNRERQQAAANAQHALKMRYEQIVVKR